MVDGSACALCVDVDPINKLEVVDKPTGISDREPLRSNASITCTRRSSSFTGANRAGAGAGVEFAFSAALTWLLRRHGEKAAFLSAACTVC